MSDTNTSCRIAEFYNGRSILITGATGFMGKVLVEKLLRSCSGLSKIYLLMRPKRGSDVKTRLDELISATIFDWIRKDCPEYLSKLHTISGDITCPQLGISEADQKVLVDNVSIVFHAAATVKFDEVLKLSVSMNLLGTKRLVELCEKMTKLEALVHVSTAYCNCNRQEVNELIYPPPTDPEKIIQCIEWMDEDLMETITPRIIGNRPNTYTFTKALAEQVLVEHTGNLPIAIVRPSIVTAAWKEPLPGWVDNLNGPTGLLAGAGKGILRTILCYTDLIADLIPVDIAINLMITVAWHTATARPSNIMVYNCTSGTTNPVLWKDVEVIGRDCLLKNPYNDVLWYPGGSFKTSRLVNYICLTLFQTVPAYIIDTAAKLTGKQPIMVKVHHKFQKAIAALEFFTTHEWKFTSDNVTRLLTILDDQDKKMFDFDVRGVNWSDYIENYVLGIRTFVLKEDPSTMSSAKSHLKKMYVLHRTTQILALAFIWRLLIVQNKTARTMWYSLLSMAIRMTRSVPLPLRN